MSNCSKDSPSKARIERLLVASVSYSAIASISGTACAAAASGKSVDLSEPEVASDRDHERRFGSDKHVSSLDRSECEKSDKSTPDDPKSPSEEATGGSTSGRTREAQLAREGNDSRVGVDQATAPASSRDDPTKNRRMPKKKSGHQNRTAIRNKAKEKEIEKFPSMKAGLARFLTASPSDSAIASTSGTACASATPRNAVDWSEPEAASDRDHERRFGSDKHVSSLDRSECEKSDKSTPDDPKSPSEEAIGGSTSGRTHEARLRTASPSDSAIASTSGTACASATPRNAVDWSEPEAAFDRDHERRFGSDKHVSSLDRSECEKSDKSTPDDPKSPSEEAIGGSTSGRTHEARLRTASPSDSAIASTSGTACASATPRNAVDWSEPEAAFDRDHERRFGSDKHVSSLDRSECEKSDKSTPDDPKSPSEEAIGGSTSGRTHEARLRTASPSDSAIASTSGTACASATPRNAVDWSEPEAAFDRDHERRFGSDKHVSSLDRSECEKSDKSTPDDPKSPSEEATGGSTSGRTREAQLARECNDSRVGVDQATAPASSRDDPTKNRRMPKKKSGHQNRTAIRNKAKEKEIEKFPSMKAGLARFLTASPSDSAIASTSGTACASATPRNAVDWSEPEAAFDRDHERRFGSDKHVSSLDRSECEKSDKSTPDDPKSPSEEAIGGSTSGRTHEARLRTASPSDSAIASTSGTACASATPRNAVDWSEPEAAFDRDHERRFGSDKHVSSLDRSECEKSDKSTPDDPKSPSEEATGGSTSGRTREAQLARECNDSRVGVDQATAPASSRDDPTKNRRMPKKKSGHQNRTAIRNKAKEKEIEKFPSMKAGLARFLTASPSDSAIASTSGTACASATPRNAVDWSEPEAAFDRDHERRFGSDKHVSSLDRSQYAQSDKSTPDDPKSPSEEAIGGSTSGRTQEAQLASEVDESRVGVATNPASSHTRSAEICVPVGSNDASGRKRMRNSPELDRAFKFAKKTTSIRSKNSVDQSAEFSRNGSACRIKITNSEEIRNLVAELSDETDDDHDHSSKKVQW
ncbi:nucleolar and coiled-body phosphoprotein 1-like [Culex pipiens pallens]|uniref:nucleolar and coiled-body phosphoprotein 1-like n=1 Tax=Culex pipiens pallens TaxID=42434 RepID=UPI001952E565|nr:nucleolar and coiled-body phosphoprotein 1-like [Culex pipiens pallens]